MSAEIQKNGGDDKSKTVERNPSNILPGIDFKLRSNTGCYVDPHVNLSGHHASFSSRRVLHLEALQPIGGPRRLPPLCRR